MLLRYPSHRSFLTQEVSISVGRGHFLNFQELPVLKQPVFGNLVEVKSMLSLLKTSTIQEQCSCFGR